MAATGYFLLLLFNINTMRFYSTIGYSAYANGTATYSFPDDL